MTWTRERRRSSGIEDVVKAQANRIEVIPGLEVPIARVPHLIAMKVLARDDERRPQDAIDLRALVQVASDADVGEARTLLELVAERGFDRGRTSLPS